MGRTSVGLENLMIRERNLLLLVRKGEGYPSVVVFGVRRIVLTFGTGKSKVKKYNLKPFHNTHILPSVITSVKI